MRKVFFDVFKEKLPELFKAEFPDFRAYKPPKPPQWKPGEPSRMELSATIYFRRIVGHIWEIIGVRRYTQDEWTLEIIWSVHSRFPSNSLGSHYGAHEASELAKVSEGHTSSRSIGLSDWSLWSCSVPFDHPEFKQRFMAEYPLPVDPLEAAAKVVQQLAETAKAIRSHVLPLFEGIEKSCTQHK